MVSPGRTPRGRGRPFDATQEWLVGNGLGGFASSTLAMTPTRRYHGLLIAAESDARTVVLNRLDETLVCDGVEAQLTGGVVQDAGAFEFRLDAGLPVWTLTLGSTVIERRLCMPHGDNAVHVRYRLLMAAGLARLRLRPWLQVRALEDDVSMRAASLPALRAASGVCALEIGHRVLTMQTAARVNSFVSEDATTTQQYPMEAERGYPSRGELWSPGWFEAELEPGGAVEFDAVLYSSVGTPPALDIEQNELRRRAALGDAAPHIPRELVLAADQFLVTTCAAKPGGATRSPGVIAGYHWFGRWGRDTMISLDGLALHTGRVEEATSILRECLRHVRRGLIPNLFPDEGEPLYHTADATLWLFQMLHRVHEESNASALVVELLPVLRDIIERHLKGTDFNIRIDPADGLLSQGVEDLPLTWMDAKVGDWVVTPRRGKAVELQALWYNALCLMAAWEHEFGDATAADVFSQHAEQTRASFNERFWNPLDATVFDVVDGDDGDDPSCRPNQMLALSLAHPVLDASRWEPVLATVEAELLTPAGLRTLAPRDPRYQPRYDGDRRSRDAAYHQGTVWPWLTGPYADACRRARGDDSRAREVAHALLSRPDRACAGQIAEIHDAEPPYSPRGCVAQAWSVAEVIRCMTRAPSARGAAEIRR